MRSFNREELVQTLFEETGDALFLFDPDTEKLLDVNPAAQRLSGFSRRELLQMEVGYLFRSEIPGRIQILRQSFHKTGAFHSQEGFLLRTNEEGVWIPLNLTATRLHVRPKTLGLINGRDMRDHRRTQDRLERAETELRRVLASVSDYVWSVEQDAAGRVRSSYFSPVVEKLTCRPPEFYTNWPTAWLSTIHAKDRPALEEAISSPNFTGGVHEYRVLRPDGQVRWLRNSIQVTFEADGRRRLDGVVADVTEHQASQHALLASEARYRSLTENLEQCIFLKDRQLRFVAGNRGFCQVLGINEAELVGKSDWDFYPPELAAKYQRDDRGVLSEGKRLEVEEENLQHGKLRCVRVIKTPVKDSQGNITGVLGIFWDVTEQRALEAQLRQAQKMEAIGQLAGGLAHDFNNLLTVILGNVELLQIRQVPEPQAKILLGETQKAVLRAAELTRKMLGFSRRSTLRLEPVNLNHSIAETVSFLKRTFDPRVVLAVRMTSEPWLVLADAGQINQVLMNLCINARDAMPEGGSLRLESENVTLDEEAVRLHLEARPGEFLRLRVEDTGSGIRPEVLGHIFEPFFTTKEPGKGTGLGLAMVFGIVKQHQGWIECISKEGKGTRFDIYLPRHLPRSASTELPEPPRDESSCHGHETILLVDDEPMIRNLGRIILQSYGYQVHLAGDGAQAVELYQREPAIDLVILDQTMPRLSGRDAFRRLLQIDPQVRVLFASGYSAEHLEGPDREKALGFVAKPYRPNHLAQAVRAALDTARGGKPEPA